MIIIAGQSNIELAEKIAGSLNCKLIIAKTKYFEDRELLVKLDINLIGEDVIIFQSLSKPVNDNLMEILLLIDATKRAKANKITLIIPYLAYSRQNNLLDNNLAISVVTKMFEGVDQIITFDLHSKNIEEFFSTKITNISPLGLFKNYIKNDNLLIVSPDKGGEVRAREFSQAFNCDLAIINKIRNGSESQAISITGEVRGKNCVIIDDIIDTGNTICKAAELLIEHGALSVECCASHAVLSSGSLARIEQSPIKKIYVSDSIKQKNLLSKIRLVSLGNLSSMLLSC
jgi:ribose-phosphate pyrophosphokinase